MTTTRNSKENQNIPKPYSESNGPKITRGA